MAGFHALYLTAFLILFTWEGAEHFGKTLIGAQTVAGVVLLFFLGLGLRNRFRLH